MTAAEHEAARGYGLTVERGMAVGILWQPKDPRMGDAYERGIVVLPDDGGEVMYASDDGDHAHHAHPSQCAPDLSDPATYLLALRQGRDRTLTSTPWERYSAAGEELRVLWATAGRGEYHPARLAELLWATATEG